MKKLEKGLKITGIILSILLLLLFTLLLFLSSTIGVFSGDVPYSDTLNNQEFEQITHEGVLYERNEDVHGVLLLGLQQQTIDNIFVGPQADTIVLATINTKSNNISLLNVSRDLISTVFIPDVSGGIAYTDEDYICNVYSYGASPISPERITDGGYFTMASLSHELMDIPIDRFFAIDFDIVKVLLAYLFELSVEIEVPLTPTFAEKFQITDGSETVFIGPDDVEFYLRFRDTSLPDGGNSERMQRQLDFLNLIIEGYIEVLAYDTHHIFNIYNFTKDMYTTNLNLREMAYLIIKFIFADDITFESLAGDMQENTFVKNETEMQNYILQHYYTPVQ